eukprot:10435125-Heterocapsa_arctica.AAC.1
MNHSSVSIQQHLSSSVPYLNVWRVDMTCPGTQYAGHRNVRHGLQYSLYIVGGNQTGGRRTSESGRMAFPGK